MTFTQFPLHDSLQRAITAAGYQQPTPIQTAAIPLALTGQDLLGTAQTGTGKTAAYVLPLLHRLLSQPASARRTRALVLAPTRELAEQVHDAIRQFARNTAIRSATIYGGVAMAAQDRALRQGTDIIVACPGRLLDHASRGAVNFSALECLVLDEADRMLDMGFLPSIRRILRLLPEQRQTMLFSATFAPELHRFVADTMRAPERVEIGMVAPADTITHALYPVPYQLKTRLLTSLLHDIASKSVLIFTRTKHRADRVAASLSHSGFSAAVLHSNRSQSQRQRALDDFRSGKVTYLVATDIASRGIDVSTISHVVNYDIPACADDYIHRIGRTGRACRNGEAFTLITQEDFDTVRVIEKVLGERIPTRTLQQFDYAQQMPAYDPTVTSRRGAAMRGDAPSGHSNGGNKRPHPGMAYLSSPEYLKIAEAARKR